MRKLWPWIVAVIMLLLLLKIVQNQMQRSKENVWQQETSYR